MTASSGYHVAGASTALGIAQAGAVLERVVVNTTAGATLYDSTSAAGSVIAVIAAAGPTTLTYGLTLKNGLSVVATGGDLTIVTDGGQGVSLQAQ